MQKMELTTQSAYPTPVRIMPASFKNEVRRFGSPKHVTVGIRFGQRLRSLRLERNLTQVQLAKHLGIDRSFLSDVERGKKMISLSYLETVAQGFDLSLGQLLVGL